MTEVVATPPPSPARASYLYLHEWLTLIFVAVGVFLLERLPVTYPRTALFLAYASPILIMATIAICAMALRRRSGRNIDLTWREELGTLVRSLAMILVAFPVAFLLKSFIYLINSKVWDPQLIQLDVSLHFGFSPTLFLTTLFGEPALLRAFDLFYTGLYYLLFVSYTGILLAILPLRQRLRFGAAFVLLWIIGTTIYLLLPSWGPAFFATKMVEETLRFMPHTMSVQAELYQELSSLVHRPLEPRIVRFGCVAAFPSLHVGVMVLFTLASRLVSQSWSRINAVLIGLMVIGSVITGYHYLVDAYGGAVVAAVAWWLGGISTRERTPLPETEGVPAPTPLR